MPLCDVSDGHMTASIHTNTTATFVVHLLCDPCRGSRLHSQLETVRYKEDALPLCMKGFFMTRAAMWTCR
jgi:hypothetical protein